MATPGYFGQALVIDVGTGSSRARPIADSALRAYIGGVGLGTHLLRELLAPGTGPLDAAAPIAFVFSPLVGTPVTTSAKFAVVAKSPLTNRLNDALSSSHFAIAGKLTGNDAIILTGASSSPVAVIVDEHGPRLEPADDLWGMSAAEAEETLRARLGQAYRVAAIGPAGERLVRYATVSHDGRHAGRGGLGAVLGSKRVKAIAVRPLTKVGVHDPPALLALARDLRERSHGPATEKYRSLGTLANLLAFNAVSTLPTRNFSAASFAEAPALAAEEIAGLRTVTRESCASCSIGCEHIYRTKGGGQTRVEYENVFALGPLCGVGDADAVLEASRRCDHHGLDTISAGGTIAWAMECAERGLIDAPWLRFGSGPALLRALDEIGTRTGLGDLLAEGTRLAAAAVGHDSIDFAAQVKGLELPGYEPRSLQTMALGLAVSSRGADHNRSGAYEADLSGIVDRLRGGAGHAQAAVDTEDRAAAMDSLVFCKFLRGIFSAPFDDWAGLLAPVTGWDMDGAELRTTAERIVIARRLFNLEHGWTRAEDTLPRRFLTDGLAIGSDGEARLDAATLDEMIDAYYAIRGLDRDGLPRDEALDRLGLTARDPAGGVPATR